MFRPKLNSLILFILFASATAIAFWHSSINQPLVDIHDFRQTQTALTTFFLNPVDLQTLLNYETPVFGKPWSIPMEFPTYQFLAFHMQSLTLFDLDKSGRLVSLLFGVLVILPVIGIMRIFKINDKGIFSFILLYLTSGIYLYWNRTFMIESTSLFFSILTIYLYLLIRNDFTTLKYNRIHLTNTLLLNSSLFFSLTISLLTKPTTSLPVLSLIGLDIIYTVFTAFISRRHPVHEVITLNFVLKSIAVLSSIFLLFAWINYADSLKEMNEIGIDLTSQNLRAWNYGTIEQRFSKDLWLDVVIDRMFTYIGFLPALLLLFSGVRSKSMSNSQRIFVFLNLYLTFLPLLVFTNLHIRHNYYQSANQIYLLISLATCFSVIRTKTYFNSITLLITLFVIGSYVHFYNAYYKYAYIETNEQLEIGEIINTNTTSDSAIMIFGADWNPAIAYHSKRKALYLPGEDNPKADTFLANSDRYLGQLNLGAIVTKMDLDSNVLNNQCPAFRKRLVNDWEIYICNR